MNSRTVLEHVDRILRAKKTANLLPTRLPPEKETIFARELFFVEGFHSQVYRYCHCIPTKLVQNSLFVVSAIFALSSLCCCLYLLDNGLHRSINFMGWRTSFHDSQSNCDDGVNWRPGR